MFPLKRNSRGGLVRVLQYGLGLTTDGIFGPNTQKAVKAWQKKMFLEKTGVVSQEVWESIFQFETIDPTHLQYAKHLLNIREEDIDGDGDPDNRSEVIDAMTSYVWNWYNPSDQKEGAPWCAIFISYCLFMAYGRSYNSARVKEWYDYLTGDDSALELKSKSEFQKDKIYIGGYLNDKGYGHIFFVDPVQSLQIEDSKTIATIEGNTNDGGSRDGNGVWERQRKLSKYWIYGVLKEE